MSADGLLHDAERKGDLIEERGEGDHIRPRAVLLDEGSGRGGVQPGFLPELGREEAVVRVWIEIVTLE